jgi:hypothetical protein
MQHKAPEDQIEKEDAKTEIYGIGEKSTDRFGRQCLLARRLCDAGVRFIQVTYGDYTANPAWDQHSNLHRSLRLATDRPVAALLQDLKQRPAKKIRWCGGVVNWTERDVKYNGTGRDHNPGGFTIWLAGGGVKSVSRLSTDDFGHQAD